MSLSESQSEDSKSRPFICPCGKNYLSYPALFTHIKQKHNGTAPGEVIRPRSVNKRGRPRKYVTDLPSELLPPLPDYKNSVNRPILKYPQVQSPPSFSVEQPQVSQKPRLTCDFIPPIPTSHLSIIKNYQSPLKHFKKAESIQVKEASLAVHLLQKLKTIFSELSSGQYLATPSLQTLIKSNQCYQQARLVQRRNTRHLLGNERYQMEFRSAVFLFLQACEDQLSKRQYKNLEILMSLLIAFNLQMTQQEKNITTQNYIKYLNNFSKKLLEEVVHQTYYQDVFSLQKQRALKLLEVFHLWLIEQRLSQHEIEINPNFRVEGGKLGSQKAVCANQHPSFLQLKVTTNQV